MKENKFNPSKLEKLNNLKRLQDLPPDFIWEKLKLDNANVLVEIGAGTAFFSIELLKKSNAEVVHACDISEVMIDWMKENITPNFPNIVPVKTSENIVPLADEIADLVFTINLHHELDDVAVTLQEAFRMLKPGGKILIADFKKDESIPGPPMHLRFLAEQVKEQLKNSGFRNIELYQELPKHFVVIAEKLFLEIQA